MATKSYTCIDTCFYSKDLQEYKEGHIYPIADTQMKEFKEIGFDEHFREDTTAKAIAADTSKDKA